MIDLAGNVVRELNVYTISSWFSGHQIYKFGYKFTGNGNAFIPSVHNQRPQPTPIGDILAQACKVQEYEQETISVL